MKFIKFFVLFAVLSTLLLNCDDDDDDDALPDLIVESVVITQAAHVVSDHVELGIRAIIKNQGDAAAGIFKVSAHYVWTDGVTYVVSFLVEGQSSAWYPFTTESLAAGATVTFDGTITFGSSVENATIDLYLLADSCSGDEFSEDYCRVEESNEENNESSSQSVTLPNVP